MVKLAFFQLLKPVVTKTSSTLPELVENILQGKQKIASFSMLYSSQLYSLKYLEPKDLFCDPNAVLG